MKNLLNIKISFKLLKEVSGKLLHFASLKFKSIFLLTLILSFRLSYSNELPSGGLITEGSGSISQSSAVMTVVQNTDKMVAEWQSFNIGYGNTVNFIQPSSTSIALNRVIGSDVSVIQGALNSNGQVFLINPNGVLFSPTAQVSVGGIVASTHHITNADFLANHLKFEGNSSNSIINQGNITVANGGALALISAKIVNDGDLIANQGNLLLGAGNSVTIDIGAAVKLQVSNNVLETLISNGGAIRADAGTVMLTSQAAESLASSAINNTGLIEAQSLSMGKKGEVILFAHDGDMNLGGIINATGSFVETSGKAFNIKSGAVVNAEEWLIDPVNITIDSSLASTVQTALATGGVTITTDGSCTGVTCSGSGSEGNITVNSAINWNSNRTLTLRADNNITVNADLTHTGTSAGGGIIFLYGQNSANGGSSSYSSTATVTSPSIQWRKGSDANSIRYAILDGNYFIGGKYIEVGVCGTTANCSSGGPGGKFGTSNKPSLFFGRFSQTGIGMVGDADGFGIGNDLRIDYFMPGTPAEQFTVKFDGISDTLNFATTSNSGTYSFSNLSSDNTMSLTYSGVISGLKVEQNVSLKIDDAFFKNQVTLTNTGLTSLANVYFARSFDPDNTVDLGGGYSTNQKIEQTLLAGDSANVVSATSSSPDAYSTASGGNTAKIIYYSTDPATIVGYGGSFFGGSSMSSMLSVANSLVKGNTSTNDEGIGIIYNAGSITAGGSKTFSYLTSLDNRDITTILNDLSVAADSPSPSPPNTSNDESPSQPQQAAIQVVQNTLNNQPTVNNDKKQVLQPVSFINVTQGNVGSNNFGMAIGNLHVVNVKLGTNLGSSKNNKSTGNSSAENLWAGIGETTSSPGLLNVFVANQGINSPSIESENE